MAIKTIGVEVGDLYLKVADCKTSGSLVEPIALGYQRAVPHFYTDDTEKTIEMQSEIIKKIFNDLRVDKKQVSVVIPDTYSFYQILDFAKLNEKELLSAVRYQADQFIPMSIDEVSLDIEILREDKEKRRITILIVASPKKIIQRIQTLCEYLDLTPVSIENELSALSRIATEYPIPGTKGLHILVNFGFDSSTLYLLDADSKQLISFRNIKFGINLFLKELKFNFDLMESKGLEALRSIGFQAGDSSLPIADSISHLLVTFVDELNRFIVQTKQQYSVPLDTIYLTNGDTLVLGLVEKLKSMAPYTFSSYSFGQYLKENPISKTFSPDISLFISAISASLR